MNSESNFNIIQKKYEKEINEIKNSEEELYKKKLVQIIFIDKYICLN